MKSFVRDSQLLDPVESLGTYTTDSNQKLAEKNLIYLFIFRSHNKRLNTLSFTAPCAQLFGAFYINIEIVSFYLVNYRINPAFN